MPTRLKNFPRYHFYCTGFIFSMTLMTSSLLPWVSSSCALQALAHVAALAFLAESCASHSLNAQLHLLSTTLSQGVPCTSKILIQLAPYYIYSLEDALFFLMPLLLSKADVISHYFSLLVLYTAEVTHSNLFKEYIHFSNARTFLKRLICFSDVEFVAERSPKVLLVSSRGCITKLFYIQYLKTLMQAIQFLCGSVVSCGYAHLGDRRQCVRSDPIKRR